MTRYLLVLNFVIVCTGFGSACSAQTTVGSEVDTPYEAGVKVLDTGVLESVEGFKGDVLNAEITGVEDAEDGRFRLISIVVPIDPDDVDQVQVESPSGELIKLKRAPKITLDYGNDEVGVVIALPKNNKLGFRLKLIDVPDE